MKLIAFTGKKGTGKSTACSYLEEKYGFTRVNFKDALIAELKQNFPDLLNVMSVHYEMTIDALFEEKPPMVRCLMQNYGTNVRRRDQDDCWVQQWWRSVTENNYTAVNVLETKLKHENIAVDDCRFLNEAAAVKDLEGTIVRLIRPDMEHADQHQSETEMDSIIPDYTITLIKYDLEHLHRELDAIMK